jgi:NADP-dependent 3-hydroxy acid dehydrogenase YdfG
MSKRPSILVTGASRGIGKAIALALARGGFDLVLWARSSLDLQAVADECRRVGATVSYASVDIGDANAVALAAAQTLPDNGMLRGAVLNAGGGLFTALRDLAPDDWQATIDTNLNGTFHTLRECIKRMPSREGALIVAISSDSALFPFPNRSAYSAAKSGVRALMETARLELRADGIRISMIFPGRVDTCFKGSHATASPGTRRDALHADDVARVVSALFTFPDSVEIREVHIASMHSGFGPFASRQER